MSSDTYRFPEGLEDLIPYAERFGIADDGDRWNRVEEASRGDLAELVDAIDAVDEGILYGWLEGPESESSDPSDDYVAASALVMAAEHARIRLEELG